MLDLDKFVFITPTNYIICKFHKIKMRYTYAGSYLLKQLYHICHSVYDFKSFRISLVALFCTRSNFVNICFLFG